VVRKKGKLTSGRTVRIETFEQLINIDAGRQFSVSKAHQRKARNRYKQAYETRYIRLKN
jgi:hypothetical protein